MSDSNKPKKKSSHKSKGNDKKGSQNKAKAIIIAQVNFGILSEQLTAS
jgi:hypothetical protein